MNENKFNAGFDSKYVDNLEYQVSQLVDELDRLKKQNSWLKSTKTKAKKTKVAVYSPGKVKGVRVRSTSSLAWRNYPQDIRDSIYDGCVGAWNIAVKNGKQDKTDKQFKKYISAMWKTAEKYLTTLKKDNK